MHAFFGRDIERPLYTWKKQPERLLDADTLTRIFYLIGIFRSLHILHGEKPADEWVRMPNTNRILGGDPRSIT